MIKTIVLCALALGLIAPAPAPPAVYTATVAIVQSEQQPGCSWENAPARLSQRVYDPIGYPYGEVASWRCDGDSAAVIADLQSRVAEMQTQAAEYRAAHPIH